MSDRDTAGMARMALKDASGDTADFVIRRAVIADLPQVQAIDESVTRIEKSEYWQDVFERFASRRIDQRFFLVAVSRTTDRIVGYIVGEVRAWEFGSEPCGWVFSLSVDPDTRLRGIGEKLFHAIGQEFRDAGIGTMRTMVLRSNMLSMAFFRSEGMVAGPYTQLEMDLDLMDKPADAPSDAER